MGQLLDIFLCFNFKKQNRNGGDRELRSYVHEYFETDWHLVQKRDKRDRGAEKDSYFYLFY